MNKKIISGLAIAASAALTFGVVATSPANAATKTVTLAFQGPLTGGAAQAGQDELAGAKYALAVYNATNPAVKIKLVEKDDKGSGSEAAVVAPSVASDKSIIGVIGSAYSGASANSFPSYKATGLTMISPSASRYTLTVQGAPDSGYPVFHRVLPNDKVQGPALARYATKGITAAQVYLVDDQSPYGAGLASFTKSALAALTGVKLVGEDHVLAPATDYSSTSAKVKNSKATVVIYAGYDQDAGIFVKSLRDAGYKGIFASGDGSATQTFIDQAGAAAEDARLTEGDTPFQNFATAAQLAAFTAASGVKVPGGYVTNTINAFNAFAKCISGGSTTRAGIARCVANGTFDRIEGGTFSFLRQGDMKGTPPVGAFIIKKGVLTYVSNA